MLKFLFLFVCLTYSVVCHAQRNVHDLLPEHTFTEGIEGPATDREGNIYAVNYQRQGTIGKITPAGEHSVYAVLHPSATASDSGQKEKCILPTM